MPVTSNASHPEEDEIHRLPGSLKSIFKIQALQKQNSGFDFMILNMLENCNTQ